jgi:hypothetical protein
MVQIWGTDYCEDCEYLGKKSCGGKQIRKKGVNEKRIKISSTGL